MFHPDKPKILPHSSSLDTLCNRFSKHFTNKIAHIRSSFVITDVGCHVAEQPLFGNTLQCCTPHTTGEVRIIILKCPNKSCDLGPFPTFLLKRCIDQLIHPITTIINKSMQDGVVIDDFKQAMVNPLIKKRNLGRNELKSYRPISNMRLLSRVLENVVENRLHDHISSQHL